MGIVITDPHNFKNPLYHPSLQMVDDDITAVEKSVLECATAGCSSIWICCTDEMQPLVRKRVGDYVKDPVILNKSNFTNFPEDNRVSIPIYFYSPHPKDRTRRPGPAWGLLNACLAIYYFSFEFSRWLAPNKYYVSFCYGLYDFDPLSKHRRQFMNSENTLLHYKGDSMFSGCHLGACLTGDFVKETIISLKRNTQVSGSDDIIFENLTPPGDFKIIEISEYFSCDSWESYVEYIKNKKFRFKYDRKVFFNMNTNGVDS